MKAKQREGKPKPDGATLRDAFVREYLVDLNQKQAAIRAGYSQKTAETHASRLMRLPTVRAAIEAAMAKRSARLEITQDRALKEAARLAFSDIRQIFDAHGGLLPVKDWPDDLAACISSVEVLKRNVNSDDGKTDDVLKVRLWDKPKNLEMLFKHLGLLIERVEVTGSAELMARLVAGRKRVASGIGA